jgi:hypothetical protein
MHGKLGVGCKSSSDFRHRRSFRGGEVDRGKGTGHAVPGDALRMGCEAVRGGRCWV